MEITKDQIIEKLKKENHDLKILNSALGGSQISCDCMVGGECEGEENCGNGMRILKLKEEIEKLKKENETNQIEVLQIKFDVWRECMCQFDPQYSVDDEIAFLRDNTDDETIVKKVFDKHYYEENGWVYNLETHDYDDTEWEKFKQEISPTL